MNPTTAAHPVRDGRRLARPLQAVYVAMRSMAPTHAGTLQAFHDQMELSDEEAMSAGGLDPDFYQGWAWWAEKILEEAGYQPERPVREEGPGLAPLLAAVAYGAAVGAFVTWLVMR